jgi:hypothetical protein
MVHVCMNAFKLEWKMLLTLQIFEMLSIIISPCYLLFKITTTPADIVIMLLR